MKKIGYQEEKRESMGMKKKIKEHNKSKRKKGFSTEKNKKKNNKRTVRS